MKHENATLVGDGPSRRRSHLLRRIFQLILLAVAADLVLLLAELAAGLDPLVDIQQRPILYLYVLGGTLVVFGAFGAVLGSREAQLEDMAFRDSVTGLLNSRYLHERLREELAAARRHGKPTSLVLFDIDHFKRVNDEHGHPVGDQVLQLVGRTMRSILREGEIAARVGGEEFALLLPGTSVGGAAAAAERIREAIGQVAVVTRTDQRLAVTVSAGVACSILQEVQDAAELYGLADQALYQAKRQGRDRAIVGATKGWFLADAAGGSDSTGAVLSQQRPVRSS
ncbi:MAG: GGDEF domain-containing protein [Pseudomonadota bacterium]